ncbi:MAG: dihydroorotate dehydrogenase electron transfer subunit [bacterium]
MASHNNAERFGIYDGSVLSLSNLSHKIYLMRIHCPQIAKKIQPGQFVNMKVGSSFVPLLRKPFSVCRCNQQRGWLEILWKVVGVGTQILTTYRPGDRIDLLGPLGNGFTISNELKQAVMVAGGIGVAPFPFLCERVIAHGATVELFLGGKSRQDIVFVKEFERLGVELHLATEDGSAGAKGLVTELLQTSLRGKATHGGMALFCCGPDGLLKRLSELSQQENFLTQISLETMMGCGFGICMGCPVQITSLDNRKRVYKLTCVDGPVFDARQVVWHD